MFNLSESFGAGDIRYFVLAYQYRYEDEYPSVGLMPQATAVNSGNICFGAKLTPSNIAVVAGTPHGETVTGWVKPANYFYITAFKSSISSASGCAIETTNEKLFTWLLYNQICVQQSPAVYTTLGTANEQWHLWIKDRTKVHIVSRFANRPLMAAYNCQNALSEGPTLRNVF